MDVQPVIGDYVTLNANISKAFPKSNGLWVGLLHLVEERISLAV